MGEPGELVLRFPALRDVLARNARQTLALYADATDD